METNNLVVQEKRSENNLSDQISQRLKSGIKTEIILRCSNEGEQRSITDSVSLCCLAPGEYVNKISSWDVPVYTHTHTHIQTEKQLMTQGALIRWNLKKKKKIAVTS